MVHVDSMMDELCAELGEAQLSISPATNDDGDVVGYMALVDSAGVLSAYSGESLSATVTATWLGVCKPMAMCN